MIRLSSSFTGLEVPAMLEEPRCFVIAQFNAHVTLNGFRDKSEIMKDCIQQFTTLTPQMK